MKADKHRITTEWYSQLPATVPGMRSSLARAEGARWVRIFFRFVAIALGAMHTWAAIVSHSMNPDGINYLDIGDALWQGNLEAALNPVWSPLYSGLLGLVVGITQPSMRWEFPVVHLTNFGIYLFALVCFEFFWRQLSKYRQRVVPDNHATWTQWLWEGIGYALFLWTALALIEIWAVTPDMLTAALIYLVAALIVGFRLDEVGWQRYAVFGALLGLAYLAKAIMFPLAILFLGVGALSNERMREVIPRFLVAPVTFALIGGTFVFALSGTAGHFTFGEAGTVTYVRYVNGIPYPHWQGVEKGLGVPLHPSRQVLNDPQVYEFGTPVAGTYPISYDPSYWYAGVVPDYSPQAWLPTLVENLLFYAEFFFREQAALLIGVLFLYATAGRVSLPLTRTSQRWGLLIPGVAALVAYGLVYVEGRYVGVFLVLIWADLLANVSLPKGQLAQRTFHVLGSIIVLFLLFNLLMANVDGVESLVVRRQDVTAVATEAAKAPSWPGETAAALQSLGIEPGDKVGVIGDGFNAFWARLARVKIVAEMLTADADSFWQGSGDERVRVLEAFASTGAEAVVAEHVPSYASLSGWHQVADTNYYIYVLAP